MCVMMVVPFVAVARALKDAGFAVTHLYGLTETYGPAVVNEWNEDWESLSAAEWGARGVRVNAVAPTYINTPLNAFVLKRPEMYDAWISGTPMARMGEVHEIASVVLFLAGEAASLMTGSVVVVDGGYTCW